MKYLPSLCQLGNCTELVVTNSCNNCCTELVKTPVSINISVTYDDVTVVQNKLIEKESDLQETLASFLIEDFVYFSLCYDTTKLVKNKLYTITINGVDFSYMNNGGTWDVVFEALDIELDVINGYSTVFDTNCIKLSGIGISENTIITATDGIIVTGPINSSGNKFPNGVYKVVSDITFDDDTTDTMITHLAFTCQLESCIYTELASVFKLLQCGCNTECIQEIQANYLVLQNIMSYRINNQIDIFTHLHPPCSGCVLPADHGAVL